MHDGIKSSVPQQMIQFSKSCGRLSNMVGRKNRSNLDQCLYPFYDMRDELTIQEELIFKGQQLVVPASLRKELMVVIHASHIGIDACIRRARDSLYWPRMATELKEYISRFDVCLAHRSSPSKEPLLQHEVLARPWSKIGADLCELNGRTLLVMVDYYSNFIEVARITSTTSRSIVKELKETFARYGVPDILVTDNGPQFASAEFAVFAKAWGFDHVTSSPHHPQSNGKAEERSEDRERAVQEMQGVRAIGISGSTRLAKHTYGRSWHQPCPAAYGTALQNTATYRRYPPETSEQP